MSQSHTPPMSDLSKLLRAMLITASTDIDLNAIQLYHVKAERIPGESNCMIKLPCKYENEQLAVLVGIIPPVETTTE